MATLPPERPDIMALMKNEPSKFRVSELVAVEPLVSVKSELNAADTWFRICAADVLWNRERGEHIRATSILYTFIPVHFHRLT